MEAQGCHCIVGHWKVSELLGQRVAGGIFTLPKTFLVLCQALVALNELGFLW